jgi:hypothetical protein
MPTCACWGAVKPLETAMALPPTSDASTGGDSGRVCQCTALHLCAT